MQVALLLDSTLGFAVCKRTLRIICFYANICHQYLIPNHASFEYLEVHSSNPSMSSRILRFKDFNAGIGAVEMLGKANFIALIGGGKQPKFPQNKVGDPKDISQRRF